MLISLWLWATLSFFWGSTYQLINQFYNLQVYVVNFDTTSNAFLPGPIQTEVNYQNSLGWDVAHVTWVMRDPSNYPNGLADVQNEVLTQQCWATVVINANATSAWTSALAAGDSSYDPTGAIGIYVQSARFYQVILNYLEPIVGVLLPSCGSN